MVQTGFTEHNKGCRIYGTTDVEIQKELIQEIFIKAFSEKARHAYDGLRNYGAFLITIARNTLIDKARKHQKDALAHVTSSEFSEHVHIDERHMEIAQEDPVKQMHWQKCATCAQEYISSLPSELQTFVQLRFVKELPQREVAKQMTISRWKTRSFEAKIKKELKKILQNKELFK